MRVNVFLPRYPHIAYAVLSAATLIALPAARAQTIPIIDAHSQAEQALDLQSVLRLMDQGSVRRTLLSNRGGLNARDLLAFARANPERITAMMAVKGDDYERGSKKFFAEMMQRGSKQGFGAISEALIWHAYKGRQAGEYDLSFNAPQVQAVLEVSLREGWPFFAHIEFGSAGKVRYAKRMAELKALLVKHPEHPIVLIHMGQLGPAEAQALIAEFPNIYFATSHANPVFAAVGGNHPWTKLFDGRKLAPAWKKLFIAHPDRFIMAFDNVLLRHWEPAYYAAQAQLWQEGLRDLPPDVAHAVAHKNAVRLWKLPPLQ